ncbi:hypothetical protein [Cytobacillus pseudoceanisediminis]
MILKYWTIVCDIESGYFYNFDLMDKEMDMEDFRFINFNNFVDAKSFRSYIFRWPYQIVILSPVKSGIYNFMESSVE